MRRGPKKIYKVETHSGEDITDDIMPHLGPNQDFHINLFLPEEAFDAVYLTTDGKRLTSRDILD